MRNNQITLETLKSRKQELVDEIDAIERLIMVYETRAKKDKEEYAEQVAESTLSTRDKVYAVVSDLVHKLRRPVKAVEVLNVIKRTRILEDMKNEQATLAAILDQEVKKKKPRLKRVARGIYDIK